MELARRREREYNLEFTFKNEEKVSIKLHFPPSPFRKMTLASSKD